MTNEYKHFIGKLCTIFTVPTNRDLRAENPNNYPQILYKYFMGVVESIDRDGLLLTQATTGLKSYFFRDQIVAIAEEQLLDPDNPEDAKVIETFEPMPPPQMSDGPFIDPDALLELSKQFRQKSVSN